MCTVHGLTPRARKTYKALEKQLEDFPRVTPMQLAKGLYPEETLLLEDIEAFTQSVPESIQQLSEDDVERLRDLAAPLENGRRRSKPLRILARKIACAALGPMRIERGHAQRLADLLESALKQDVQNRVCELRNQLEACSKDGNDDQHLTVTRAPYQFTRAPRSLTELDEEALDALYPMLDRQAWRSRPCFMETCGARLAVQSLRYGISTGKMLADDREPLQKQGIAKCRLSAPVRDDLDWVVELSNKMQQVFEMFYIPCHTSWEDGVLYFIAPWAKPHAVEMVHFVLAARNGILKVLNGLFQSLGERPYPLVWGHEFPEDLVPRGSIPSEPILASRDELIELHRRLREIAIVNLYPGSGSTSSSLASSN